jgi:SecD/SecF fusion protein
MLTFFCCFNGDLFISMFTHGFKYGIDFTGGRNYVVRFDKDVNAKMLKKN